MDDIAGYDLLERLHDGPRHVLWQARAVDGREVVVKRSRSAAPDPTEVALLDKELALLRRLAEADVVGVPRPVDLVWDGHGPAIITSRVPGQSLAAHLRRGRPPLVQAVRWAARAARVLDGVHRAGVVHKDVTPDNLVADDDTLHLVDFDAATPLRREPGRPLQPALAHGTLAYTSPEQTGRTGHAVDDRADLYGLGATFYELLTGRPPFPATDPLELMHQHLAADPRPPSAFVDGVPPAIDALVLRLLEKDPERRPSSALAVAVALDAFADALARGAPMPDAVPVVDGRFRLPNRLYGRDDAVAACLDAWRMARGGAAGLVLLTGWSGVGKSSVVNAILPRIAADRGRVLRAKAEPLSRGVPWGPVVDALSDLARQLVGEGGPRAGLADGLRDLPVSARAAITELVPSLSAVWGPTPPAPALDGEAARARLQEGLLALLRAAAAPDAPVVLFVDDVQWADEATLSWLQRVIADPGARFLLVALAWRDHEVGPDHPWSQHLARGLRDRAAEDTIPPPARPPLAPLEDAHALALVVDTLGRDDADVRALAAQVHRRSAGNPYLLRQLLAGLHDDGELRHDGARWTWDPATIDARPVGDDAGGLVATRLQRLPAASNGPLAVAAAIGARFDLRLLAAAIPAPVAEVVRALRPAVEAELIVPVDEGWSLASGAGLPDGVNAGLAFAHDRVREAALASLPEAGRRDTHRAVARALVARADGASVDAVRVAVQLHAAGVDALRGPGAGADAAILIQAGRVAEDASSFGTARAWYALARALDAPLTAREAWQLALRHAVCTWLDGAPDQALDALSALTADAPDVAGVAALYAALVDLHTSAGRYARAVDAGVEGLARLGVAFPHRPGLPRMLLELARLRWRLRTTPVARVEALPDAPDARVRASMELLNRLAAPARYVDHVALSTVLVCRMCQLSLDHGHAPQTAFAWGQYGFIIGPVMGAPERARPWSDLAARLADRFDDPASRPLVGFLRGALVEPWLRPPSACVPTLVDTMHASVAAGNPSFYVNAVSMILALRVLGGEALEVMDADIAAGLRAADRYNVALVAEPVRTYRQLVACLRGQTHADGSFDDDGYDERRWLAEHASTPFQIMLSVHHIVRMLALLAWERLDEADAAGRAADAHLEAGRGVAYTQLHPWLRLLAHAGTADTGDRAAWRRCRGWAKTLEAWARHDPTSHGHRVEAANAELDRLRGDVAAAMDGFERALQRARAGGFTWDVALIAGAATRLHHRAGRRAVAAVYAAQAHHAWTRLGAVGVATRLHASWPGLHRPGGGALTTTDELRPPALDMLTAVRTSAAIGEEIDLDRLLGRVLLLAVQNLGARHGALLLAGPTEPYVAATWHHQDGGVVLSPPAPLASLPRATAARVRLAWHTRARARNAGDRQRSELVVPLLHRGEVRGGLLLTHDLTPDAFPDARVELLDLLGGQIAAALTNATLFRENQRLVDATARFVPSEFLDLLGRRTIGDVALGDAVERSMAVLFADIRAFTSLAESLPPSDLFRHLNAWLGHVAPAVRAEGGFVDKFIGDAVLALFPRGPVDAVRAAVALQRATASFNATLGPASPPPLRVGVGVHCGPMILGTLGEPRRLETTVISDVVNVASRLEGLTKGLGVDVLCSAEVVDDARAAAGGAVRRLGSVAVRGRSSGVDVFEVYAHLPDDLRRRREATREALHAGVDALAAGDADAARRALGAVLAADPDDAAARALLGRLP